MPDFQLKSNPVTNGELAQENDGKFVLAVFVFSAVVKAVPVEFEVAMKKIIGAAYPLGVCFHRAFDWTSNPFEALEDIISLGCERILTSGQQPSAILGAPLIKDLTDQAAGRIVIMFIDHNANVARENKIGYGRKKHTSAFEAACYKGFGQFHRIEVQ